MTLVTRPEGWHPRKIESLSQAVLVEGVQIPQHWVGGLDQEAMDRRMSRRALINEIIRNWLADKAYANVDEAAAAHNRNRSQQFRQILEEGRPDLCPPIQEWRGDGARWSRAGKTGVGRPRKRTVEIKARPGEVGVALALDPPTHAFYKALMAAKPDIYPSVEAAIEHVLRKVALAKTSTKQE